MRRREFLCVMGGVATWSLAARAQQVMPVVGFLRTASLADASQLVNAFRQGLKEAGFIEGQNVAIEYRSAEGQPERVPALVADLLRRPVAVIAGNSTAMLVPRLSRSPPERHRHHVGREHATMRTTTPTTIARSGGKGASRDWRSSGFLRQGTSSTFSVLLEEQQHRGRSRHARSRASACGASACSCPQPRTIRNGRPASRRSCRRWRQLGWTIGRNVRIDTRWATANAADIRRYAAELVALAPDVILARHLDRGAVAAGDPHRADRVRERPSIRSAPASSTAWRGRAATPPASSCSNTASAGNGWNCSRRSRPA